MYLRRDSSETKRKILTVCVRLFLEQGYKTPLSVRLWTKQTWQEEAI